MGLDQASISALWVDSSGPDLFARWKSTLPAGTWFQVYLNGDLSWEGKARSCYLPRPLADPSDLAWMEVGAVSPSEVATSFASSLRSRPFGSRVTLTWEGGTYLDPSGRDDISGFRITQSRLLPGAIREPSTTDWVAAYPGGWLSDGFGITRFGHGGFGRSATLYQWTSQPLTTGSWEFSVSPLDRSGNIRSIGRSIITQVQSVPQPPPRSQLGSHATYQASSSGSGRFDLHWIASPSATEID